jgi:hypothetical protein
MVLSHSCANVGECACARAPHAWGRHAEHQTLRPAARANPAAAERRSLSAS